MENFTPPTAPTDVLEPMPRLPPTMSPMLRHECEILLSSLPWIKGLTVLPSALPSSKEPTYRFSGIHPDSSIWFFITASIVGEMPVKDKSGATTRVPVIEWGLFVTTVEWQSDYLTKPYEPRLVNIPTNGSLLSHAPGQQARNSAIGALFAHVPPPAVRAAFDAIMTREPLLDHVSVAGANRWSLAGEYADQRLLVTVMIPSAEDVDALCASFSDDHPEEAQQLRAQLDGAPGEYERRLREWMPTRWFWTLESVVSRGANIMLESFYGMDFTRLLDRLARIRSVFRADGDYAEEDADGDCQMEEANDEDDNDMVAEGFGSRKRLAPWHQGQHMAIPAPITPFSRAPSVPASVSNVNDDQEMTDAS